MEEMAILAEPGDTDKDREEGGEEAQTVTEAEGSEGREPVKLQVD